MSAHAARAYAPTGARVIQLHPARAVQGGGVRPGAPDGWEAATSTYMTWMRASGRSPGTMRQHRHYLRMLGRTVADPWDATAGDLVDVLGTRTWGPETRKSCRSVFVAFYEWAHLSGWVDPNPAGNLPKMSVPTRTARPAPLSVLEAALAHARPDVRLMMLFAAYAGLRCAEVAGVHHDDLSDGLLYVHGKGGKVRVVPLEHPELVEAVTGALGYVFPGRSGGHMVPGSVSALLSDALPSHWTGHTLRHRFATQAYAGTRDLLTVSALLGHSRPETTQRYVRLPPDALLAGVRAAAAGGEVAR
jgi:integrase/recombinase XerC